MRLPDARGAVYQRGVGASGLDLLERIHVVRGRIVRVELLARAPGR